MNMNSLNKLFFILAFSLSANVSLASLHVEPIIGYSFGVSEHNESSDLIEYFYHSSELGARVGWSYLGAHLGAECFIKLPFKKDNTSGNGSINFDNVISRYLGGFAEYHLPLLFIIRGRVIISTQFEVENGNNKGDIYFGNGYGVGVGFTGLPLVVLNIDYRKYEFDEFEDATTSTTSGLDEKFKGHEVLFSASIPLDL